MRRTAALILSAATTVAAFGLGGCQSEAPTPPAAAPAVTTITPTPTLPPAAAPLPAPTALTDVLYRMADANVPGVQKVGLVEEATADDAAALDRFARALTDNGFTPLNFEATDLAWSQSDPGNVVATVIVKNAEEGAAGDFSFPMEFTPQAGGWQLTRNTADLLLEMGAATTAAPTR